MKIDKNNTLYLAVILTEESKKNLEKFGGEYLSNYEWFNPKMFCHHMTIAFKNDLNDDIVKYVEDHWHEEVKLVGTHIGISEKACALRVLTKVPSNNEIKHITIATNINANGKPFDSNAITEWKMLENFVGLDGIIEIVGKKTN